MIEIEKKYLLKKLPENLTEYVFIKQAYIMLESTKHLRVRITDNKDAEITFKMFLSVEKRHEFNFPVYIGDALKIYQAQDNKVEKKRYFYQLTNGYIMDIDVYPNGLLIGEIEYDELIPPSDLPDFVLKEITGLSEYSNVTLAKQNLVF